MRELGQRCWLVPPSPLLIHLLQKPCADMITTPIVHFVGEPLLPVADPVLPWEQSCERWWLRIPQNGGVLEELCAVVHFVIVSLHKDPKALCCLLGLGGY